MGKSFSKPIEERLAMELALLKDFTLAFPIGFNHFLVGGDLV